MDWILKYWLQFVFGLLISAMGVVMKKLNAKVNQNATEYGAIKTAMQSMLHDNLYQNCKSYIKQGYLPIDEADEILDNLEMLYNAYHSLGGNGTGKTLYERTKSLPIQ